jgi:L-lactate dehydrogenase
LVKSLAIADLTVKIGIVSAGRVGCACAFVAVVRGRARTIVIVDRTRKRAEAVAIDLRYSSPLCPKTTVVDGDYEDLAISELVMIAPGINEKAGGVIDRSDPKGRLRLFDTDAEIYRDIVHSAGGASRGDLGCHRPAGSARRHRPHESRA